MFLSNPYSLHMARRISLRLLCLIIPLDPLDHGVPIFDPLHAARQPCFLDQLPSPVCPPLQHAPILQLNVRHGIFWLVVSVLAQHGVPGIIAEEQHFDRWICRRGIASVFGGVVNQEQGIGRVNDLVAPSVPRQRVWWDGEQGTCLCFRSFLVRHNCAFGDVTLSLFWCRLEMLECPGEVDLVKD